MSYPDHDITAKFDFPAEELKVIQFWRDIDAFQTSIKLREGCPEFSFYDGPPFATGRPHYGHLLAGTVKDIVTRHASMSGFHVERRFGWDTHGLPVEHEIDKKLGIKSKDDVMAMGIDKYNAECRAIVMRYSEDWRATVERIGRWIDFDNDYKTLNLSYMESVWWVFSQLFQKNLVYRGLRVMPYSTGCTTPLSNFEAGLAYKDIQDPSVTIGFPLVDDQKTMLLAWTTTPWTLPSNLGLCVHPDFEYIKIHDPARDLNFILQKDLLNAVYSAKELKKPPFKVIATYKGSDLKGWRYVPLFEYFTEKYEDKAFKVLVDKYVTKESGTGIVHQAPAFGEDDHRVALAHGVIRHDDMPPCPLDDIGRFTNEVPDFAGMYFKDADKEIIKTLKNNGRLIAHSTFQHSYPFCWRSDTPLIYRAIPAWFVRVTDSRSELMAANKATRWVPQSVGDNRFGNWLENAKDWNISRNRYWGTPLPLWVSDDFEEIICLGSVEELEKLSGVQGIKDIHRESIDGITIPSQKGKGVLRRVTEVFDCWFESGSMPFAQEHYPFENEERFKKAWPADFVSEGIDQTRGWFYTMLVVSTLLYGKAPWKNLIVTGLVLAQDGKKMSKSLRNYPDPNAIIDQYGADATRIFLVNSPIVRAENLRFREEGVKEVVARVLLPWVNSFRFFLGQVALLEKDTGIKFKYNPHAPLSANIMDRWVLARCQSLIKLVREEMAAYRLYTVIPRLLLLIDEVTNWYIRFNRARLKGENGPEDTVSALNTLFETIFTLCKTMSSFTPFLTESLYQTLRKFLPSSQKDERSVHFLDFPTVREEYFNPDIERQVKRMQTIIELTRTVREKHQPSLKIPLKELIVFHPETSFFGDVKPLQGYLESELNVREIVFTTDEERTCVKYKATADWPTLGKKLRKDIGKVKAALPNLSSEDVKEYERTGEVKVDGIPLEKGDLVVTRYVDLPEDGSFASNTDNDVVVLVDIRTYPELEAEGLAREFINRVQRLRKEAGLQATDNVDVFYSFEDGSGLDILAAIVKHAETITKAIRCAPADVKTRPADAVVLIDRRQEIGETGFHLSLTRK
ncbi:Isoleucine--tRNA ligase, cytoplasmic; AltName: Full=Isoleucyl-tRNA synthetase; Short=IleRS [Serendipita indica DSM 11827]|nr:Isoleucine--tRNA ligase, cytoplasmic; AltName: Full=Isoleucyl-tRNA synthetase; Short=IleRS [Serendipita indica DSM 11827]